MLVAKKRTLLAVLAIVGLLVVTVAVWRSRPGATTPSAQTFPSGPPATEFCVQTQHFCADFPLDPDSLLIHPTEVVEGHQPGDYANGVLSSDSYSTTFKVDERTTAVYKVLVITGGYQSDLPLSAFGMECEQSNTGGAPAQTTQVKIAGVDGLRITCSAPDGHDGAGLYYDTTYAKFNGLVFAISANTSGGRPVDPEVRNKFVDSFRRV